MASERGEWPLQSRSVLALCESKRATTLLAFWKKTILFVRGACVGFTTVRGDVVS